MLQNYLKYKPRMLGPKQSELNENFQRAYRDIKTLVTEDELETVIEATVKRIRATLPAGARIGAAWSGGKDSVVVDYILRRAGFDFPSCIGMTDELEYPEFMRFVTNNMPPDLIVYNSGHTIKWLSNNLDWLFPDNSTKAARWFKAVQHAAQDKFYKEKRLTHLITGRRLKDRNYVGPGGLYRNRGTGTVRYSPIFDWTHEMVLACIAYRNLPLAPFYTWPNGWIVGSGNWAARQWTGSTYNGWAEVAAIDPGVVKRVAGFIESANDYVRTVGL